MTKTEKNGKKTKIVMPAGIRNKMTAAISMLLVASIMMVSSTYAWFTLSTAPEVKGITTNVGANGNLEMMLLNTASFMSTAEDLGVESGTSDSMATQEVTKANLTWGNLVDLSDSSYGLGSIVMNPARLNITKSAASEDYTLNSTLLKAPTYDSDGRVVDVNKDTLTSGYSGSAWNWNESADNAYGVRVIGTTSGVTERLTAYRAAASDRTSAIESAKTFAKNSLLDNGQTLATIVMKSATGDNSATYTKTDLEVLQALVKELQRANDEAGTAIVQTVLAYNLGAKNEDKSFVDADVAKLKAAFAAEGVTAGTLPETYAHTAGGTGTIIKPDGTDKAVTKWGKNNTSIKTANDKLTTLISKSQESYSYSDISDVVSGLIDKKTATVAGKKNPGKDDISDITASVLAEGAVVVALGQESGIYADIAELVGDYTASGMKINVDYGGLTLKDMNTTIKTTVVTDDKTGALPMITKLETGGTPQASDDSSSKPLLTDHYGYALDLGFRTNAAVSDLLLQTESIQRVYSGTDAATATSTQGGGSYMQFTSNDTQTFSVDELRALMSALRVVFVEPQTVGGTGAVTYNVLGVAAADITGETDNDGITTYTGGTLTQNGVEVKTQSAERDDKSESTGTAAVDANGLKAELRLYNYTVEDGVLTLKGQKVTTSTTTTTDDETASEAGKRETETKTTETPDNTLTSLTQNVAKKITAIVYLDGDIVDNTMVANAATSMTGSLNLQFSSSAALKPMEESGMRSGGQGSSEKEVTYTKSHEAGTSFSNLTVGDTTYTGTVNSNYAIYKGSDGNYYYSQDEQTYTKVEQSALIAGNCPAITVTANTGGTGTSGGGGNDGGGD